MKQQYDVELLKSFIKKCKGITATFTLDELLRLNEYFSEYVLNSDGSINEKNFKDDPYFYDVLFAM